MVKITCETKKGGAANLNKKHGVYASYAVATAGDLDPSEIFYAGVNLTDGRSVQFFLNRETGLIVVDLQEKGNCGRELLRVKASDYKPFTVRKGKAVYHAKS